MKLKLSERLKRFRWIDWLVNRGDIILEVEKLENELKQAWDSYANGEIKT